jgi:tetratricopeptide (TPR) repeat protein
MRTSLGLSVLLVATLLAPSAAAQSGGPSADSPPTTQLPASETQEALSRLRSERQFQKALSRLTTLREKHPDQAGLLWRRALLLTDLGKTAEDEDQAIAYYRRAVEAATAAVEADSTAAWPHAVKALAEGRLCLQVGRKEKARRSMTVKQHAERALAIDSSLAVAYHTLGRWHRQTAELGFIEETVVDAMYDNFPTGSLDQSAKYLRRALALQSKSYHHVELGKTYRAMEREAAARRQFRKALGTSGSPLDPEYKAEARRLLDEMQ